MSLYSFRLGKPQVKPTQAEAERINEMRQGQPCASEQADDVPVAEPISMLRSENEQCGIAQDRLISALSEGKLLLLYDHQFILRSVSEAAIQHLSLSEERLGEMSFLELLHPSHRELFASGDNLPIQKRAQLRAYSGGYDWYALHYHPQPGVMLLVLEPINHLVQTEKQLRKAQIEVEHSARERSEFLRHMSHELRTPLNAMMGFARMMEEGIFGEMDNPMYEEYVRLISRSGESLLSKIVDLMDLSAIGSHHVSLYEVHCPIHDVLRAAIEDVQKVAATRHVRIQLNSVPQHMLYGDRRLLRKSLCQILQNAVEYNDEGGEVSIDSIIAKDGTCHMIIRDNGHGMQHSQLRPLQSALQDSVHLYSNVEAYRPIGLGLTLAKEYLHLHQGDIMIDSQLGVGTVVTLKMPAERVKPHDVSDTVEHDYASLSHAH